jgi:hypothetical protein
MSEYAGYKATVYMMQKTETGTTISSSTNEDGLFLDVCLDPGTYKTYTTSNLTKRLLDTATTVVAQRRENPPGGVWTAMTVTTDYTFQHQGCILRRVSAGTANTQIRLTGGKYFTLTQIAEATDASIDFKRVLENVRCLGEANDKFLPTTRGATIALNKWWDTDINFFDYLGDRVFIMLNIDGANAKGHCAYARLNADSARLARDGVVSEALQYNVDGTVYFLY